MKRERDISELARLLKAAIVRPEDVPGPDSPEAQRVLQNIKARRRRRKTLRRIAPMFAVLVVAAGAVYVSNLSQPHMIVCFEAADLDSNRFAPSIEDGSGTEACHSAWESGELTNPQVPPGHGPQLVGCTSTEGSLWVFPSFGAAVCSELGLEDADLDSELSPVELLAEGLRLALSPPACVPVEEAEEVVANVLADLDMGDWTIEAQPGSSERPCTSFGLDTENSLVHLIPIPSPLGRSESPTSPLSQSWNGSERLAFEGRWGPVVGT